MACRSSRKWLAVYGKMQSMDMELRELVAKRLHQAMDEHPHIRSQPALQSKSGVAQSTIGRILRAEVNVGVETLGELATALDKPLVFFLSEAGENRPPESDVEIVGGFDPWDDETPVDDDETEVPLYQEVELAAGVGTKVIGEHDGAKLRFSRRTLRKAGVDPAAAACAKVHGNSMEPVLQEGTTVGIDRTKTSIRDGDIYVIDHEGMLRIKLLYRLPGGGLRIASYNKDEWPDEYLEPYEAQKVRILGRVFWWSTLR